MTAEGTPMTARQVAEDCAKAYRPKPKWKRKRDRKPSPGVDLVWIYSGE
jgi:hypothetical protein